MSLTHLIRSDYRRYCATDAGSALGVILLTQGLWASSVHRLNHWVDQNVRTPGLRRLQARACGLVLNKLVEIITGVSLPVGLEVGEGLYLGHFGPIIVSPRARLGRHCNLSQGVTIGLGGRGDERGAPILGNRVYVGPGAILFGKIEIGDDVAIGAGAVVTRSVPSRAVVVGNPGRVISSEGSFEFVRFDGMEQDAERHASLAIRSAAHEGH